MAPWHWSALRPASSAASFAIAFAIATSRARVGWSWATAQADQDRGRAEDAPILGERDGVAVGRQRVSSALDPSRPATAVDGASRRDRRGVAGDEREPAAGRQQQVVGVGRARDEGTAEVA